MRYSKTIIAFVGPVGAGKSTHIMLLSKNLKEVGIRSHVTNIKANHLFAFFVTYILARIKIGKRRVSLLNGYKQGFMDPLKILLEINPEAFRKILNLWLILEILSINMKILFQIIIVPILLRARIVIVEDYPLATLLEYHYISKTLNIHSRLLKSLESLILRIIELQRPLFIVYVDALPRNLFKRWKTRGTALERLKYINFQRVHLKAISKSLSNIFIYVDTTKATITKVQLTVLKHVLRHLETQEV